MMGVSSETTCGKAPTLLHCPPHTRPDAAGVPAWRHTNTQTGAMRVNLGDGGVYASPANQSSTRLTNGY